MSRYKNKHKIWIKFIATIIACLLFIQNIAWAYPGRDTLSVQSMFNEPISSRHIHIRDIGIIKYYFSCLSMLSELKINFIPEDVNATIKNKKINKEIDVKLEFSQKDKYKAIFMLKEEECVVPCKINSEKYYAYVTTSGRVSRISDITIFTEEQFCDIEKTKIIAHEKVFDGEDERILSEEDKNNIAQSSKDIKFKNLKRAEERGDSDHSFKSNGRSVINLKFVMYLFIVEAVLFVACQFFIPEIALKSFISFLPGFMNTNLRVFIGFIIFATLGEVVGQLIRLRQEGKFNPGWHDFNRKTILTAFLLIACIFGWFWPWTYTLWVNSSLPKPVIGLADQLFTCPVSMPAFVVIHGLVQHFSSTGKDEPKKAFTIKALLQEKIFPILKVIRFQLIYSSITLGIIFSVPLSLTVQSLLASAVGPPVFLYLGYQANRKVDINKTIELRNWAKLILPILIMHNFAYFPWNISIFSLGIGALLYIPTLYLGFREIVQDKKDVQEKLKIVKSHPKEGGSPADHLITAAENKAIKAGQAYTLMEYRKQDISGVSRSTVYRDAQKNIERGFLRRAKKDGRTHEYKLTDNGLKRVELIENVKEKAKGAVRDLRGVLFNSLINTEEGTPTVLALDTKLGKEGTRLLVAKVIQEIWRIKKDNQIDELFKNLIIVKGSGKGLIREVEKYIKDGKDGQIIEASNVVMITKSSNKGNCENRLNGATITFVDDSELEIFDYYPIVELIVFTLGRALANKGVNAYKGAKLKELFDLVHAEIEENQTLSDNILTMKLKPIESFKYDELQHIYRNIIKFLQAA